MCNINRGEVIYSAYTSSTRTDTSTHLLTHIPIRMHAHAHIIKKSDLFSKQKYYYSKVLVNYFHAELISENTETYLHFQLFLDTGMEEVVISLSFERQGPIYPIYSIPGLWWPGNIRSLDISSHSIDLFCPKQSGFSTRRVNIRVFFIFITDTPGLPLSSGVSFYEF